MIRRATLTPLVVALCTASLISAGVLQHQQTRSAALAAEQENAQRHMLAAPPPIVVPQTEAPVPQTEAPQAPAAPTSVAAAPSVAASPSEAPVQVPIPPRPVAPPKPVLKTSPCAQTVRACLKLSSRQAWLLDGTGRVILGPVPVTSGKMAARTGTFKVLSKEKDHDLDDSATILDAVFFEPGEIAFHTGSLRAQTSGSIHLATATALQFFSHLNVGDPVQVLR